jgi:uncharacterized protein YecT (DUF1311 family)
MNKKNLILALTLSFLLCPCAHSQSQPEMNETAQADFEKADAKLNAVYKKTLATLDDEGKKKLIAAERAWVAYRDAEAAFVADSERGGSIAPLIYSTTCRELTESRIQELHKAVNN